MRLILMTLFAALPLAAIADPAHPFAKGDPKIGKQLHDRNCIACHVRLYGGDGSEMYTRIDRKIDSPQALLQRVSLCSAQANAGWFPEEEEHVAAWLNQRYYKFK